MQSANGNELVKLDATTVPMQPNAVMQPTANSLQIQSQQQSTIMQSTTNSVHNNTMYSQPQNIAPIQIHPDKNTAQMQSTAVMAAMQLQTMPMESQQHYTMQPDGEFAADQPPVGIMSAASGNMSAESGIVSTASGVISTASVVRNGVARSLPPPPPPSAAAQMMDYSMYPNGSPAPDTSSGPTILQNDVSQPGPDGIGPPGPDGDGAGRSFPCGWCDKSYNWKSTMKRHQRVHTGERPFQCRYCPKAFVQKAHTINHERTHTGERRFFCDVCGRRFAHNSNLLVHKRSHTNFKPFHCDICGKGFLTKADTRRHRRVHTGEKPFACDICGKRFAQRGYLNGHRRIHTGEKPYACELCPKRFALKSNLNAHHHTVHTESFRCNLCKDTFRDRKQLDEHRLTVHSGPGPVERMKVTPDGTGVFEPPPSMCPRPGCYNRILRGYTCCQLCVKAQEKVEVQPLTAPTDAGIGVIPPLVDLVQPVSSPTVQSPSLASDDITAAATVLANSSASSQSVGAPGPTEFSTMSQYGVPRVTSSPSAPGTATPPLNQTVRTLSGVGLPGMQSASDTYTQPIVVKSDNMPVAVSSGAVGSVIDGMAASYLMQPTPAGQDGAESVEPSTLPTSYNVVGNNVVYLMPSQQPIDAVTYVPAANSAGQYTSTGQPQYNMTSGGAQSQYMYNGPAQYSGYDQGVQATYGNTSMNFNQAASYAYSLQMQSPSQMTSVGEPYNMQSVPADSLYGSTSSATGFYHTGAIGPSQPGSSQLEELKGMESGSEISVSHSDGLDLIGAAALADEKARI
eukprot:174893_1